MVDEAVIIKPMLLGNSNAFIVAVGEAWILVDGGLSDRSDRILAEAAALKLRPERLEYMIVTHAHYDHVGSIKALKKLCPQTKIVAHKKEAERLLHGRSPVPAGTMLLSRPLSWLGSLVFRQCIRFPGFATDIVVDENFKFNLAGVECELFHTPGHTDGSLSLRVGRCAVFVGDTVFHLLPGCFYPPFADDESLISYSWQKICATRCKRIYPGHGRHFLLLLLKKAVSDDFFLL